MEHEVLTYVLQSRAPLGRYMLVCKSWCDFLLQHCGSKLEREWEVVTHRARVRIYFDIHYRRDLVTREMVEGVKMDVYVDEYQNMTRDGLHFMLKLQKIYIFSEIDRTTWATSLDILREIRNLAVSRKLVVQFVCRMFDVVAKAKEFFFPLISCQSGLCLVFKDDDQQ